MIPSGYLDPNSLNVVIGYQMLMFPQLVTTQDLPQPSIQGRTTSMLRISHAPGQRRQVLFQAGTHAREIVNPDMLLSFCYHLCDAYVRQDGLSLGGKTFSAQEIRSIVQKLDLLLVPMVNPDGRAMVFDSDPLWRKNCNPLGTNAPVGVDLNRNQSFCWAEPGGSSTRTYDETYRGPAPGSEPEGANIRWVLGQYPGIWCFVDVHSYSGLILYPWGDDDNQTTDPSMYYGNPAYDGKRGGLQYQEYIQPEDLSWYQRTGTAIQNAIAAVRGHVYSLEQSFSLYEATGTFADTAYARPFGVRAFTFETGRSFQPEWPEAESVMQEGMAGLLQLCLLCLPTFEGAWEGTGTVTQGGMPRTAPFRFEFAPAALGGFSMAEYHNWQGNDLPSTPNNTGTPTPLNGQILIITFEASAPGWTTENRWSLRVDPVEEHIQFSVATTITPPPP